MEPKLKIRENKNGLAEAMGSDCKEAMATVAAVFFTHRTITACLSDLWNRASTPEEAMLLAYFLGRWVETLNEKLGGDR